jgi:hypothetical protein
MTLENFFVNKNPVSWINWVSHYHFPRQYQLFLVGCLCLLSFSVWADTLQRDEVPPPLQPWVDWVLHDTQDCPLNYNQSSRPPSNNKAVPVEKGGLGGTCRWPSRLTVKVNAGEAEFSQQWQVYSAGWLALPGNAKHWPQSVKVNNKTAKVVDREGVPSVFAPKGHITIAGQFQWKQQHPEFLQIPAHTGLVALSIDNTPVTLPKFDAVGRLWLKKRGTSEQAAEENRLDMRVYRHIIDEIPLQIVTRLELDVAGRHREVMLGPVMLDKHKAMSLNSPLPARLESDGHLRLQVRPGSWTLTLHTRQEGEAAKQLTLAASEKPSLGQWVHEEVWVFEARNNLRLVEVSGVTAIDPQQTALPAYWRKFPAYLVRAGDSLVINEKRRGDPEPAPDQLKLKRQFWLDFDGFGYSVQDRIDGTMTRGWRLEMAEPAVLGRVAVNGRDQFITCLKEGCNPGVEVRRGQIDLVADSRLENTVTQLPAVGWAHDFQKVSAILHLPPGWRLLNATGVDNVRDTWLKRWTLLDLFIVLIMAAAVGKLWRWWWGGLTLVTMILSYHEPGTQPWLWFWLVSIIASLALLRVLPTLGWFSGSVRLYRNISLIGLLIIVLPFMMQQARQSIYPQLERPWATLEKPTVARATPSGYDMSERKKFIERYDRRDDDLVLQAPDSQNILPKGRYEQKPTMLPQTVKRKKPPQIDPNAQVQTGPGLPQWKWNRIKMGWSGPVQQTQSIELWLLSPLVNSALGAVRVVLLAILTVFFLWVSWGPGARLLFGSKATSQPVNQSAKPSTQSAKPSATAAFLLATLLGVLLSLPLVGCAEVSSSKPFSARETSQTSTPVNTSPSFISTDNSQGPPFSKGGTHKRSVQAEIPQGLPVSNGERVLKGDWEKSEFYNFPPQSLLDELQKRLNAPPDCLPYCAGSPRLLLELEPTQLHARIEIHSLADIAVPLPGLAKQWLPQQVLLDGEPAQALLRHQNGQLWLSVSEGIHHVQIAGPLAHRNTVQLPLPLKPHFVEIKAKGWRVEGLHENGVADDLLQFTREQTDDKLANLEMGNLPPFVQVERTLLLSGLDWQVETRVVRKTPLGSAIKLEIPLLLGESVTSEQIRVEGGKALISLSPNQSQIGWVSVFDRQDTITLTAPNNTKSSEVWRLNASALWHVKTEGIPVVHHQTEGRWLPEWRPWPGESVSLHISRPDGVDGQVLTIDRSQLIVTPGQHTTDNQLLLSLRSSRGMQHELVLPLGAQLQSFKINGKSQPIRQDEGQENRFVTLPITPGTQQVELQFQQSVGMSQNFFTPRIDLGIKSVNTLMQINMLTDRWILFTGGKPIGPAVMIWGILIVIVLVSVGLGQISLTPLKFPHWLLLGVVLSQVPIPLMLCVVAWFMALGLRAQLPSDTSPLTFNAIQIGLGFLTVVALITLVFAIKQGLLGSPNMHIAGNGSDSYQLRWYEDHTAGILPQVWVFSLSMWVYRIAMLLWALWLSFALLRWLRWGWECFSTHSLWKPLRTKKAVQT